MNKGIEIGEVEREFVGLGGTVDRNNRGHVLFTFPGLPAVGVHQPRARAFARAPRRLVSMLRKVRAGVTVTTPRAAKTKAESRWTGSPQPAL